MGSAAGSGMTAALTDTSSINQTADSIPGTKKKLMVAVVPKATKLAKLS